LEKYQKCTTFKQWVNLASPKTNELSRKSFNLGEQLDNFAVTDIVSNRIIGEIEFRIKNEEFARYLMDTQFLLKIQQSQCKNTVCWFFDEKLSRSQARLQTFLNSARKLNMVRRFKVSNDQNYLVVRQENPKAERLININEPRCQIYDHVELRVTREPIKSLEHWKRVVELNNKRGKKNHVKIYGEVNIKNLISNFGLKFSYYY